MSDGTSSPYEWNVLGCPLGSVTQEHRSRSRCQSQEGCHHSKFWSYLSREPLGLPELGPADGQGSFHTVKPPGLGLLSSLLLIKGGVGASETFG